MATTSAMGSTPRSLTLNTSLSDTLKRKLQVYVEIPPSPLHSGSGVSGFAKINAFKPRKSGTPLTNKALNINTTAKLGGLESPLKKQKLDSAAIVKNPTEKADQAAERNAKWLEKFPSGFLICHQCRKHKGIDEFLSCVTRKGMKPCNAKYCNNCVRAHYAKHGNRLGSHEWRCPRCDGKCVCWRCTKGKVQKAAKAEPVYLRLSGGTAEVVPSPSRLRPTVELPISPGAKFGMILPGAKVLATTKVGKPKKKQVVPQPKWVEVDTELSKSEAEDRFFVREFILRFSQIMEISQSNLESLDDFDHLGDGATKAYIVQLLTLIAADAPHAAQSIIKTTTKRLSSVGFNPGAVWAELSSLRETVSPSVLSFPDPDEIATRTSRLRTSNAITSSKQLLPVIIALIEVAIRGDSVREEIENGLADIKEKNKHFAALKRDENQRWVDKNEKATEEKIKGEKMEGWDAKKWTKQLREASAKHKKLLHDIDCQHAFEVQAFAPRFAPVGVDSDGRVYYVSTGFKAKKKPSANERTSLHKWSWFLAVWGKVPPSKEDKTGGPMPSNDVKSHEDGTHGEDVDGSRWWGFADPAEIKTLAKWLADKEGLNDKDIVSEPVDVSVASGSKRSSAVTNPTHGKSTSTQGASDASETARRPSKAEIKHLVKSLNDYADVLAWRIGDQKDKDKESGEGDSVSESSSSKGKGKKTTN